MGFNKEEVKAFLEIVAVEFEELANQNILLKKRLDEKDNQIKLMDESRGDLKEILNTLQLMRKDNDSVIKTVNHNVGSEMKELLTTVRGFKEQIMEIHPKDTELTTKEDLEKFISTVQKVKEEELDKATEEAKGIINEARQRADEIIREIEGETETKREKAALVINEAQQKADEIFRLAESEMESHRQRAVHIVNEAQQKAENMVRFAESEAEADREKALQIVNMARQKAEELVRKAEAQSEADKEKGTQLLIEARQKAEEIITKAEGEAEEDKERAAQIIRESQQKAATIIREAKDEEDQVRIAISNLKKRHRLFEHRIKEVIEFHLNLLGSVDENQKEKENLDAAFEDTSSLSSSDESPFTSPD
ncbi:MAG: DivIVA domain-containing protein, partial [Thermodesulfobacteriota bacterium]